MNKKLMYFTPKNVDKWLLFEFGWAFSTLGHFYCNRFIDGGD